MRPAPGQRPGWEGPRSAGPGPLGAQLATSVRGQEEMSLAMPLLRDLLEQVRGWEAELTAAKGRGHFVCDHWDSQGHREQGAHGGNGLLGLPPIPPHLRT